MSASSNYKLGIGFRKQLIEKIQTQKPFQQQNRQNSMINIDFIVSRFLNELKSNEIDQARIFLGDILSYYWSNSIQNIQIIQTEEFINAIFHVMQSKIDPKMCEYAYKIIFAVICKSIDFSGLLIHSGFLDLISSILNSGFDSIAYYFILKIILAILSFGYEFYEDIKSSQVLPIVISFLSNQSEIKGEMIQSKDIIQAEKYGIKVLAMFYQYYGNDNDVVTEHIIKVFVKLLNNRQEKNKIPLKSIILCAIAMIEKTICARYIITNTGLLQFINSFLRSTDYMKYWPYIFQLEEIEIQVARNDPEQLERLIRFIRPKDIYNIFNFTVETIEKENSQKLFANTFNLLSLLSEVDPNFISRDKGGITLEDINQVILVLQEEGCIYELKESGVFFLLHILFNSPDKEYISKLLEAFGTIILDVLYSAPSIIVQYALFTFRKLSQYILSSPDEETPIHLFFKNTEFRSLIENFKDDKDAQFQEIASALYDELINNNIFIE